MKAFKFILFIVILFFSANAFAGPVISPKSYPKNPIFVAVTTSGAIDSTIVTTTAAGDVGHYSYLTHTTNALTGSLIGMRGNARVDTTDSPAGTVMGGKFQAGNMGAGTDLLTATGVYVDVVNKIPSGGTTWTNARGYEVSMDLDQGSSGNVNTITNAYMFYGVYNLPTVNTYATVTNGYGIFVRNEAVGGTGQMLDAAFYADDRNHSGSIYGWDFGIDFSGVGANSGAFGTADIRGQNGEIITNSPNGTWDFGSANLLVGGVMIASNTDVACNDTGDTCAYTGTVSQHWITGGGDAAADTMTVTAGVDGQTMTFTLVGGTDDVVIDVNSGTDTTLTGASEDSVTYRYNGTTSKWHII